MWSTLQKKISRSVAVFSLFNAPMHNKLLENARELNCLFLTLKQSWEQVCVFVSLNMNAVHLVKQSSSVEGASGNCSVSMLGWWHLCFWDRRSTEYLYHAEYIYNMAWGITMSLVDVVVVREDSIVPSFWPLAKVVQTYPVKDGLVWVVDVKTSKGIDKRHLHLLNWTLSLDLEGATFTSTELNSVWFWTKFQLLFCNLISPYLTILS